MFFGKMLKTYFSNDHNSAVRRATELILGVPYTSRPSRSSWDPSRSIPAYPGRLFEEHICLQKKQTFSKHVLFSKASFLQKKVISKKAAHDPSGPGPDPAGPGPGRGSGNFVWELLLGPNRAHQLLVGIGTISLAGSTVVTAATGSGRRY